MNNTYHNPVAIANYFIKCNNKEGLSLMQLLKLSYIAHGFKLALLNQPLSNELAQAWKYGPVFPRIYNEFKYEPDIITDPAEDLDESKNKLAPITSDFNEKERKIMNLVYQIYGSIDGWRLSVLTHKEGTPWHEAWYKKEGNKIRGVTIPNSEIKKHFKEIIEEYISQNE